MSDSAPLTLAMFGTGDFAVPTFLGLLDGPHNVVALYTQPERGGAGRHQHAESTIKRAAIERGVEVRQPLNINTEESLAELRALSADVFVVAAYGQLLSPAFLAIPRLRTINVHASILPRWRGASPINHAIWMGDAQTGVTIIEVTPGLDAGPMLAVERTPILPTDTTATLEPRLAAMGPRLVAQVLEELRAGRANGVPQDPALVTRSPKLRKEQGRIDWSRTAVQIDCQVRGLQPWPVADTLVPRPGKPAARIAVLEVAVLETSAENPSAENASPGTVVDRGKTRLVVVTGQGELEILRVQAEGKRPMSAAEYLRGAPIVAGTVLGVSDPSANISRGEE
jgi:methionyl-tRNA formyltransferase